MARIILPSVISPLTYPGRAAGFDPSHIASKNVRMSAVASGANFYSLLTGARGTPTGITSSLTGALGPVANFVGGGSTYVNLSVGSMALPSNATFAAFFTSTSSGSFCVIASASSVNLSTWVFCKRGNFELYNGSTEFGSGIPPATNAPYFGAVSTNSSIINFVLKRLDTGQVLTSTISGGTSSGSENNYSIGGVGGNGWDGSIAAAMYAAQYMTVPQLLQWAQDPWAFWYPRTLDLTDMLSPPLAPAAPAFVPGLLQTRSIPGLGPQSRHIALLNAALPTQVVAPTVTGGTLPFMGVG